VIETQTIVIRADGSVALPDLTSDLALMAEALGGDAAGRTPGRLGGPRLAVARGIRLPVAAPEQLDESQLWRWHEWGAVRYRSFAAGAVTVPTAWTEPSERAAASQVSGTSWLALKHTLAHRLLGPICRLCARRCAADRSAGQIGFCGLGADLRLTAPVRLWGEEPELGRPGLGLMAAGCGLRCRFCYRPENLPAAAGEGCDPRSIAGWIDAADDVEHVHFLGGNPDESLPGILAALAAVRVDRPVVWNTHSYLTASQAALLEGVVDGFVADLKFGPGPCAERIAGLRDYWPAATATLRRLARFDSHLLVRHVALPGHLDCCAEPVARWLKTALPQATILMLDQYEPLHRAVADPVLGRILSGVEQARLAALANWLGGKDGKQHG